MPCPPPYGMPCVQPICPTSACMPCGPCAPPCGPCPPACSPCGPGQPCFGMCSLPVPKLPQCADPRAVNPCCQEIPCEPPQMMVAYRKAFSNTPGKEEYQCFPCYFKLPKPCPSPCTPPQPFPPC